MNQIITSLDRNKDLRIQILLELNRLEHSHEQILLNDYLSNLKTVNGQDDLGTVRRCLIELRDNEFIVETDEKTNIIDSEELQTRNKPSAVRSCKLFVEEIIHEGVTYKKIDRAFLVITLKGKKFLADLEAMEYQKLIREQEQTIRDLSETNLQLSNALKGFKLLQIIVFVLSGGLLTILTYLMGVL